VKPQFAAALFLATMAPGAPPPPQITLADVPAAVIQEMQTRGCKALGKKPKNVIRGEFIKTGQLDWAALCLTKKQAILLVFPDGAREQVMAVETVPRTFSNWSIAAAARVNMNELQGVRRTRGANVDDFDHDGINSSLEYGDKTAGCFYCFSASSQTYYHSGGEWAVVWEMIAN
jgi:hypothetical protein